MAKKPIKPLISFAEQLQQLQGRGLRVEDGKTGIYGGRNENRRVHNVQRRRSYC